MHMRMQVSTGWRKIANQEMPIQEVPPARSMSNRNLALVASYLLTFLLHRWVSSVHVSFIQRLANCWATIQKQAHFSPILQIIRQSMSTLFLRHLA